MELCSTLLHIRFPSRELAASRMGRAIFLLSILTFFLRPTGAKERLDEKDQAKTSPLHVSLETHLGGTKRSSS